MWILGFEFSCLKLVMLKKIMAALKLKLPSILKFWEICNIKVGEKITLSASADL